MANEQGTNDNPVAKRPRGFAALPREQRSAISRLGGKAAHVAGTAHEWDHEEASLAGRKGGRRTADRNAAARIAQNLTDADEHHRASGE